VGLLGRARNPLAQEDTPWDDTRPALGGVEGRRTDWIRWYPPDTPFGWGQGFPTVFSNVPAINGGRWINEFLPDAHWQMPYGVALETQMWPAAYGSDGRFQSQLSAGTPRPPTGVPVATVMFQHGQALSQLPAASLTQLAGGFGRS
jgi:hypothetical protein